MRKLKIHFPVGKKILKIITGNYTDTSNITQSYQRKNTEIDLFLDIVMQMPVVIIILNSMLQEDNTGTRPSQELDRVRVSETVNINKTTAVAAEGQIITQTRTTELKEGH
jgi:hypothetical protein